MTHSNICVSIGGIGYTELINRIKSIHFAEIRIDMLDFDNQQLKDLFLAHNNLIATCRYSKKYGDNRFEILQNCLEWGAAYVDIEIDTDEIQRKSIVDLAKKLGRKVIVSYHNYDSTPDAESLNTITQSLFDAGADIAKIACMVKLPEDNAKILGLYADFENLVAIGMGTAGIITRVIAPLMGAPFTFASVAGIETSPGQLDEHELSNIVNLLESYTRGRQ